MANDISQILSYDIPVWDWNLQFFSDDLAIFDQTAPYNSAHEFAMDHALSNKELALDTVSCPEYFLPEPVYHAPSLVSLDYLTGSAEDSQPATTQTIE